MDIKPALLTLVREIPYGHVTSYGHLATLLDIRYGIQSSGWMVGRILSSLTKSEQDLCPRWRVVNKQGVISALKLGERGIRQIQHLKAEGVIIDGAQVNLVHMRNYTQPTK